MLGGRDPRQMGSPPLARGTACQYTHAPPDQRITPACAGNRVVKRLKQFIGRDHPRLRGEQAVIYSVSVTGIGSPPLARGTVSPVPATNVTYWITPACAGNRICRARKARGGMDHPRLRGEQQQLLRYKPLKKGSPPLARGTVMSLVIFVHQFGITPACAGNRFFFSTIMTIRWDHPRLRGEQPVT